MDEKEKKIIKRMKVIILIFGVLTIFNIIILTNNKSFALFKRNVTSNKRIVEIHVASEFPSKLGVDTLKKTLGQQGGIIGVTTDNTKVTVDSDNIREYRYSGLDVNNYVYFNCSDSTNEQNNTNCETWRIIGIFKDDNGNENIKIVRNTTSTTMKWDSSSSCTSSNYNNCNQSWTSSTAAIRTYLNESYLTSLTSKAQNMIEEAKWYLGGVTYDATSVDLYTQERNGSTWPGKIALMYPSDYGYSVDDSYWKTATGYGNFTSAIVGTGWLYKTTNHSSNEWFFSPSADNTNGVAYWLSDGDIGDFSTSANGSVRPTIYLKSDVKITGGNGSSEQPYKLQ